MDSVTVSYQGAISVRCITIRKQTMLMLFVQESTMPDTYRVVTPSRPTTEPTNPPPLNSGQPAMEAN